MGFSGCNPVKHLKRNQYLIQGEPKIKTQNKIPATALQEVIRARPNRRMLLPKTYLHLYNLGKTLDQDSSKLKKALLKVAWFNGWYNRTTNWLQYEIGEPPALLDSVSLKEDSARLHQACFAQGFFYPQIDISIDTLKHNQVNIRYQVREGVPYIIRNITYSSPEGNFSPIERYYQQENSRLKPGMNYNHQQFIAERARATESLRNHGYFTFSQKMIEIEVDTNLAINQISDSSRIQAVTKFLDVRVMLSESPERYGVGKVEVHIKAASKRSTNPYRNAQKLESSLMNPEYREKLNLPLRVFHDSLKHTFFVDNILLHEINYNFLDRRIHLDDGEAFSQSEARKTQQRLQELGMFQYVIMNYSINDSLKQINVKIDLQMANHLQVKTGMEAFTQAAFQSSNLPSLGANFSFRNRNAFRKSELLQFDLMGNVGFYSSEENAGPFQNVYYEVGSDIKLTLPRFLLPFPVKADLSLFSPNSAASANWNREERQEYARTRTGLQLNYRWNHKPFSDRLVSQFTPLNIELIDTNTDAVFQETIVDKLPPAIQRDFDTRISSRLQYRFTWQNYRSSRIKPTYWLQLGLKVGGNIPFVLDNISSLSNRDDNTRDNLLFGRLFYGQFISASAEGKYAIPIGKRGEWVFRTLIGGSVPYNNTPTLPRESRFFSGGTNSMRGWQSNTLGPGTSSLSDFGSLEDGENQRGLSLIAPGGEWIFEVNAEYRFDLGSYAELAVFTDAGNVWFHNSQDAIDQLGEKSVLSFENLRLGWDAGVGMRFDFSFLILRLDIGQQIFAPDLSNGWVFRNISGLSNRTQLNLGIGYPF